ncbi:MAG TPA: hypothetical protein VGF75_05235 [Candidatus Saccharimonadales bacterium]|jgi:hypothetical protein
MTKPEGSNTATATRREAPFVSATLGKDALFCSDKRRPEWDKVFIHILGGAENFVYGLAVMREVVRPGSTTTTFERDTAATIPVLKKVAKIKPGIHSSDTVESGSAFNPGIEDGPLGCKYVDLRQHLSQHLVKNWDVIRERTKAKRPELFTSEFDDQTAEAIKKAHASLAKNNDYFGASPHRIANTAVASGALSMIVIDDSVHTDLGWLNMRDGTTLDSDAANFNGDPAYDHDTWAVMDTYDRLHTYFPFDRRQLELADALDSIAVYDALGITDPQVRR